MKRVRLKHHKSLALYQTFTDSGHSIGFEITRPSNNPIIITLRHVSATNARHAFKCLTAAIELIGLHQSRQSLRQLVTGRGCSQHTSR